jgi:hypothetical protein
MRGLRSGLLLLLALLFWPLLVAASGETETTLSWRDPWGH